MPNPLFGDPAWKFDGDTYNGTTEVATLEHNPVMEYGQGTWLMSISADAIDGKRGIFSKDARYLGDGGDLTLYIDNGRLLLRQQNPDGEVYLDGGVIREGDVHSIAFTYGAGGVALYVDGTELDSTSVQLAMDTNFEPLVIGANQWASTRETADRVKHFFDGSIQDVAFYSAEASASDVAAWANGEFAPESQNAAPLIVKTPSTVRLDEGDSKSYLLSKFFADPDGDALRYTITDGPGCGDIIGRELVIAPGADDSGVTTLSVVASDGQGAQSDELVFSLRISDVPDLPGSPAPPPADDPAPPSDDNDAPVIEKTPYSVRVDEGLSVTRNLDKFFSDPNGDDLAYVIKDGPDYVYLNDEKLVFAPGMTDSGEALVTVVATDGSLFSDELVFGVRVSDVDGGDPDVPRGSPTPPPPGDGKTVKLLAEKDLLTGPAGNELWGDDVTLSGYTMAGKVAPIAWTKEFTDSGYGVKGGRWDSQIDYSQKNGGQSERFEIDFNGTVDDVILFTGMLGLYEGSATGKKESDPDKSLPETGKWTAYDANDKVVDTGLIGPDLSILGPNKKVKDSYGIYPIDIDTPGGFSKLVLEATQWGHGEGVSWFNDRYGENNSDFAVSGLEYTRIDYDIA
jgi:hypothetical protein